MVPPSLDSTARTKLGAVVSATVEALVTGSLRLAASLPASS